MRPGPAGCEAGDGFGQFALAVPLDPGHGEDFAGAQFETDARSPPEPSAAQQASRRQVDPAAARPAAKRRAAAGRTTAFADHRQAPAHRRLSLASPPRQAPCIRRARPTRSQMAKDILKLVTDQDHGDAGPSERGHRFEQPVAASSRVSTAVGSSRIRIRASRLSALTISTRCCSPIVSCPVAASGSRGRTDRAARRSFGSSRTHTGEIEGHGT